MTLHIRYDIIKNVKVPMEIFKYRKLSTFENIVFYLYHKLDFRQTEIAFLLKRDPATIWTVLKRAEEKYKYYQKQKELNETN